MNNFCKGTHLYYYNTHKYLVEKLNDPPVDTWLRHYQICFHKINISQGSTTF